MDLLTMEKMKKILALESDWCVSLYMPTHRAGRDMEQDPIRFKNLLREVEERLLDKGLSSSKVQDMLKKPQRLFDDSGFWQHQSDGLAMFISENSFHFFRLPVEFAEKVVVTNRFHVKPLLPILTSDGVFHILAISQNKLRLLEGTRHGIDEIDLGDTPETLAASFPDGFPEKQLQFHTNTPMKGGAQAAMFFGHDPSNDIKDHIRQWFRTIDKAVTDLIAETHSPLVLAGVDSHFPLYNEVNTYPYLLEKGISGNPDEMKPEDLHPKAWAIVEPMFSKERETSLAQYRQLAGTGNSTSNIAEAVLAAHHGQIATLFIASGTQVWGRFDSKENKVHLHETQQPGDKDLLDFAAIETLSKGGKVFVVSPEEVPDKGSVAAILRY